MSSSFLLGPTHITSVFSKLTLSPCLLNISFHSISCSWRSVSSSATTVTSSAYNSFRSTSFVPVSSTTTKNNNGLRTLRIFTSNSSDTPGPRVSLLPSSRPPLPRCHYCNISRYGVIWYLQVYETNCQTFLSFQCLLYLLLRPKLPKCL